MKPPTHLSQGSRAAWADSLIVGALLVALAAALAVVVPSASAATRPVQADGDKGAQGADAQTARATVVRVRAVFRVVQPHFSGGKDLLATCEPVASLSPIRREIAAQATGHGASPQRGYNARAPPALSA